jgi:hypothetical protein
MLLPTCDVSKAMDTLSSRHVSLCDVNACSWDVRGDLTLNSMAQIHTSVTLLTSHDLAWNSGRLTCQHASQISAVAHISWDVTSVSSALQTLLFVSRNGGNAYWKARQRIFLCDSKSPDYRDKHMRTNAWEGIGKELKIKRKFNVSSRDVRIVCLRLNILISAWCLPLVYLCLNLLNHQQLVSIFCTSIWSFLPNHTIEGKSEHVFKGAYPSQA